MKTLLIRFYKEVRRGMSDNTTLELVEFKHKMDETKSDYENMTDAYGIAISKGHNPNKNIMVKEV